MTEGVDTFCKILTFVMGGLTLFRWLKKARFSAQLSKKTHTRFTKSTDKKFPEGCKGAQ